jgi:hypothetical protein
LFTSRDIIPDPEAAVVADVLHTVAALRLASSTLATLKRRDGDKTTFGAIEKIERAEGYVRELTERVQSRARAGDVEENELLRLAEAVLDGRRRLPDGIQVLEAA